MPRSGLTLPSFYLCWDLQQVIKLFVSSVHNAWKPLARELGGNISNSHHRKGWELTLQSQFLGSIDGCGIRGKRSGLKHLVDLSQNSLVSSFCWALRFVLSQSPWAQMSLCILFSASLSYLLPSNPLICGFQGVATNPAQV
jgi:hypothetical protein